MDTVITPNFRVSYPNLFRPRMNDLNGKLEFSVVALFPKDADLAPLKALAKKAVEEEWGKDPAAWPKNLKNPFRDQAEREKIIEGKAVLPDGYVAGNIFVNLKTTRRPGVVDQNVQDILDETQIYAGCWARACVNAYTYENKGNRGVAFGLQHIQKVKDDDSLSGRSSAQSAFSPIELPGEASTATSAVDLFG